MSAKVQGALLLLRPASALPPPLRPLARPADALQRPTACVFGLLLEAPPAALAPVPSRDARPSCGILRVRAQPPPPTALAAVPEPPPGAALCGLRFTLLGFKGDDASVAVAVEAALREGASYVSAPTPHNVDLVVLEPSLLQRLPEVPQLRLPDFAAVRSVRFAAGARHVEACAAARRVLDPRTDTRCELLPDGVMIVTGEEPYHDFSLAARR